MATSAPNSPIDGTNTNTKVFISYSRKDIAFADRLDRTLTECGIEPLIDRAEVYAFENWWQRIESLIAQADAVVFILTPDAIVSQVCHKEIVYAASLHKRLAPVVCRSVDSSVVPDELRQLNFIYLDEEATFDKNLAVLTEALQLDIDWVRKHTEIGNVAERWRAAVSSTSKALLLRSPMLDDAERWIATRPRGAPLPTEATHAFLAASRHAVTRRKTLLSTSLTVGLLVSLTLAGIAYWQRSIAVGQTQAAIEQRDVAFVTQSRFLATLSKQELISGAINRAIALALEALPSDRNMPERPFVSDAEVSLSSASKALQTLNFNQSFKQQLLEPVHLAALSASGDMFATASGTTVHLWKSDTGAALPGPPEHIAAVESMRFSADGSRLIIASGELVRVWDILAHKDLAGIVPGDPAKRICGWIEEFVPTVPWRTKALMQPREIETHPWQLSVTDDSGTYYEIFRTGCKQTDTATLSTIIADSTERQFSRIEYRISSNNNKAQNLEMAAVTTDSELGFISPSGSEFVSTIKDKFALVTINPDGALAAAVTAEGKVVIWDVRIVCSWPNCMDREIRRSASISARTVGCCSSQRQ